MAALPCKKCGSAERYADGKCKPCRKAYDSSDAVKARKNAAAIQRRKDDPEKARAYYKSWRGANKDKITAAAKKYRENNHEKELARYAKYRANNKEKVRASQVAYKAANRERINLLQRRYVANNPERIRILENNRRAREKSAIGKLSGDLSAKLFLLQKGKCACGCGLELGDNYHLDHIMPLALGGTNEDWNIQLLRPSCNQKKSAKHPIEFMQSRGFLL